MIATGPRALLHDVSCSVGLQEAVCKVSDGIFWREIERDSKRKRDREETIRDPMTVLSGILNVRQH